MKKKHITQKEAADQLGLSRRWVKKLMKRLRKEGDRGVLHRSRGKASNRKIALKVQQKAVKIVRARLRRRLVAMIASTGRIVSYWAQSAGSPEAWMRPSIRLTVRSARVPTALS